MHIELSDTCVSVEFVAVGSEAVRLRLVIGQVVSVQCVGLQVHENLLSSFLSVQFSYCINNKQPNGSLSNVLSRLAELNLNLNLNLNCFLTWKYVHEEV